MAAEAASYTPNQLTERLARTAKTVWLVALFLILLWPVSMVSAPLLGSFGYEGAANPIYRFFSFLCHQQYERSFHIYGWKFAVCARCFGVYFGLFTGFALYPLFRRLDNIQPPSRKWLALSTLPIGIDWTLGFLHIVENTHASRLITGMILGVACSIYLVPAFIEISRHRILKRLSSTS